MENVCPQSGEPCPLDINLDVLAKKLTSVEEIAAIESIKRLVGIRRETNRCLDGPNTTVQGLEDTIHCDLNEIPSVVRAARNIGTAFGLPEEMVEFSTLHKMSGRQRQEWLRDSREKEKTKEGFESAA